VSQDVTAQTALYCTYVPYGRVGMCCTMTCGSVTAPSSWKSVGLRSEASICSAAARAMVSDRGRLQPNEMCLPVSFSVVKKTLFCRYDPLTPFGAP
jgi:hypothetical protein